VLFVAALHFLALLLLLCVQSCTAASCAWGHFFHALLFVEVGSSVEDYFVPFVFYFSSVGCCLGGQPHFSLASLAERFYFFFRAFPLADLGSEAV
jgi:hypothetical protein